MDLPEANGTPQAFSPQPKPAMRLPIFQVDAFARNCFAGNPAAVCVIPAGAWPADWLLQSIAAENNLSETAFIRPVQEGRTRWDLRWFTTVTEVDLCGHATLGSAHVVLTHLSPGAAEVRFQTRSGELTVSRQEDRYAMDFPADRPRPCTVAAMAVKAGLGLNARELLEGMFYLALLESEAAVRALRPELARWKNLDRLGVIVTAPGDEVDFVSRFFAPKAGIDEDPVTGSAHCMLVPFWAERLGKETFHARQVSRRGGEIWCNLQGERISLCGHVADYMTGEITV